MTKVFDVDVGDDELRLKVEAVGGGKEFAVLVDEGIAAIDEVLSGFSKTAGGIDIASDATC